MIQFAIMKKRGRKHIVVIGGGTGTSVVLQGLKKYPVNLSAIITTGDDGSSSGVLRRKFQMVPPGDIRQCLVALASGNFGYLNERFEQGFLQGHTLGNLLITLFYQKNGGFQEAIDELLQITGAQGSLIPMTLQPVTLIAKLKNGRTIRGERNITPFRELGVSLRKMMIAPKDAQANPRALQAIGEADAILVGPGNLFSSILPNFLVSDLNEAVRQSRAKKIYIANLFTQPGHTDAFTLSDFLGVFCEYIGEDIFTHVVYNSRPIASEIFDQYRNGIIGESVRISKREKSDKRFVGQALASSKPRVSSASDPMGKIRNPFLHDPDKLAKALMKLL